MSTNPVNAWDARCLAASESAFGTAVAPVAAQGLEIISLDLGANEVGKVRPKKDRSLGRGMQSGWVEGDIDPIDFTLVTSLKSRAAVDTDPHALAIFKAAGLKKTTNAGVSTLLALTAYPIEQGDFASMTLSRYLGAGVAAHEAEVLRGCCVKSLGFKGGNQEIEMTASGAGIGKETLGELDSITLASGVVTSMAHTAQESYRLGLGYYICEAEIIQVTAVTAGGTSATIARGALSSTAAAHTAQPLRPYIPPTVAFTGSPIAEPNCTVTLGAISPLRVTEWGVDITTGIDMLPQESSSARIQGVKQVRYEVSIKMKAVLLGDRVDLAGMAKARPTVAVSIAQGIGVGGIATFAAAACEVVAIKVPDTANDIAIVDIELRVADTGSPLNMLNITLT